VDEGAQLVQAVPPKTPPNLLQPSQRESVDVRLQAQLQLDALAVDVERRRIARMKKKKWCWTITRASRRRIQKVMKVSDFYQ
jgi:hypothetical protein